MARAFGWEHVFSADGDANALEELLNSQNLSLDDITHLSGQHIHEPILLNGKEISRATVYEAQKATYLPEKVQECLLSDKIGSVLFFSSRTAEAFVETVVSAGLQETLRSIKALCLSDSMVKSLQILPWKEINVAKEPNRRALFDLLTN